MDSHCVGDLVKTAHRVEGANLGAVSYWLIGIKKEELDAEGVPVFVEHLRNAGWKLGENPRPSVLFHVAGAKASRHRQLRWGDEYAQFYYIDAFTAQAVSDVGVSLNLLEEVEQPTGAEPAQVVKLPTSYWV